MTVKSLAMTVKVDYFHVPLVGNRPYGFNLTLVKVYHKPTSNLYYSSSPETDKDMLNLKAG